MGRRGPQPRSEEEHRAAGTYRTDRHARIERRPELLPEPGMRDPPEWLEDEAKLVWWDLSVRLLRSGALALTDYYAMALFCETWSRWRKATTFVATHGESYLVKDKAGGVKGVRLYPHVKLANALADQLARLGAQLGLSPASRGRAAPIQDFLFEGKAKANARLDDVERARISDPLFQGDLNPAEGDEAPSGEPPPPPA